MGMSGARLMVKRLMADNSSYTIHSVGSRLRVNMVSNAETRLSQLETRSEEYVKKSDISATLARMDGKIGELATALNTKNGSLEF